MCREGGKAKIAKKKQRTEDEDSPSAQLVLSPNYLKRMVEDTSGSHRFSRMPYNAIGMVELNLLGKMYKEYRMHGNYHHDHWEMEDGNLLALKVH